jgi:Na+-driven multidrug efflux pump
VLTLASLAALMSASQRLGWGLAGVWWGIVFFFSARLLQSLTRLLWLRRRQ